jgi:hypothetical protein
VLPVFGATSILKANGKNNEKHAMERISETRKKTNKQLTKQCQSTSQLTNPAQPPLAESKYGHPIPCPQALTIRIAG